jgi:hypothetical protein
VHPGRTDVRASHPLHSGFRTGAPDGHHLRVTGTDIAMLALTLLGFVLVAMLPYAAFRLVELADDAIERARSRS